MGLFGLSVSATASVYSVLLALSERFGAHQGLSRLHRRQHVGGVNAQLVKTDVVKAEIGGRRMQWAECAVAE